MIKDRLIEVLVCDFCERDHQGAKHMYICEFCGADVCERCVGTFTLMTTYLQSKSSYYLCPDHACEIQQIIETRIS